MLSDLLCFLKKHSPNLNSLKNTIMPPRSHRANLARNGLPTFDELDALHDEGFALQYLLDERVLQPPVCPSCLRPCVKNGRRKFMFACRPCGVYQSILKGTLFQATKLPLNKALRLVYCWVNEMSVKATHRLTGISHAVISNWFTNLRLLVGCIISCSNYQIGGEGQEVQIDESKFGKRKVTRSGRGHRVDGVWVFGGVQKEGNIYYRNNKYFAICVPDRSAATLLPIIKK